MGAGCFGCFGDDSTCSCISEAMLGRGEGLVADGCRLGCTWLWLICWVEGWAVRVPAVVPTG